MSYGTLRPDAPRRAPEFQHLLSAFRSFVEDMRAATYVFENEDDIEGCKMALRAAAQLLAGRHLFYWRVFAEIHEAFSDLQKGVDPELFSRSQEPRPRSRSARRKHAQVLAAACLSWLMNRGSTLEEAAEAVARKVNKWDEFAATTIKADTLRHWRDGFSLENPESSNYYLILKELHSDPDADKQVHKLLEEGPPVAPSPRNAR